MPFLYNDIPIHIITCCDNVKSAGRPLASDAVGGDAQKRSIIELRHRSVGHDRQCACYSSNQKTLVYNIYIFYVVLPKLRTQSQRISEYDVSDQYV